MIIVDLIEKFKDDGSVYYTPDKPEGLKNNIGGKSLGDGKYGFFTSKKEAEENRPIYQVDPNIKEEKPVNLTDEQLIKLKTILAEQAIQTEKI